MKTLGQALQRLVTPEVLSDFAVTAVAATDIAEVGDELDPFDPLHQFEVADEIATARPTGQ